MTSAPLWHSLSPGETLKRLGSDEGGLGAEEAAARLHQYGANTLEGTKRIPAALRFLRQFQSPLIYVLLAAGLITALVRHWTDCGVIAAVILLDALIGFIQEQKAENALAAIRQLLSPAARVLRQGSWQTIAADQLVPGDIVMLAAGDKVPADLRLMSAHGLRTQEAILTGESLDVEKSISRSKEDAALGDRTGMAYSGTLVAAGQGAGVVVATGKATEIGLISVMLGEVATPETPLTRKLAAFSRSLALAIVGLSAALFVFGVLVRGMPLEEMFMVVIAITVSAIPEGLPAVISITLALGVRAMAGRQAIARHLPVIEALGSVTVICTDKTGTLTQNELAVTDIVTADQPFSVKGVGYLPEGMIMRDGRKITVADYPVLHAMAEAAMLNNDATFARREGVWELSGDPTEGALMVFALKAGRERESVWKSWPRGDVIPFSAEAGFMATLHHGAENSVIYVKGAPELILAMCQKQRQGAPGDEILDVEYWRKQVEKLARQGKRVLAVASRATHKTHQKLVLDDLKGELTLLGIFGIMDTPREGASEAIAACLGAGIAVKMITGDHGLTASSIGAMLGIPASDRVIEGKELERLTGEALARTVEEVNIYARMHPAHKLKLVSALQAMGETVAMTGDGVNDAPALKMADIGISMGAKGTEVAKEASSLVLMDDNFATIVHAVEEGRNVYRNIKRTIQFMLATDLSEGLVLVLAMLAGFTLPVLPLQILWVNMVTSFTLSLSFAFAPYDPGVMRHPPLKLNAPIFSGKRILLFAWHVIIITAGTSFLFLYELRSAPVETARTIAVNVLVAFQVYYLWGMLLAEENSAKGMKPYAPLLLSTLAIIALQLVFTYLPWMQAIFGTVPLTFRQWGAVNAVAAGIFIWLWVEPRLVLKAGRSPGAVRRGSQHAAPP